jgi:hypothetical protein
MLGETKLPCVRVTDDAARTNLHVWSATLHCLRIVIYNENTNSNV